MRNLFLLFVKYGHILLFLFLEFICLVLVVRYNRPQKEVFLNSSNIVTGSFYNNVNNVKDYFNLKEVADSLVVENAKLRKLIYNSKYSIANIDSIYNLDSAFQYSYIPGKVVDNSIALNNNKITIDKGSNDGVKPRMGVIGIDGIVGIVKDVSPHYSVALSILHRQVKISAAVRPSNFFGSLVWKETDPTVFHLEDIPKHAILNVGDTIVTSGYSSKFPKDIAIGQIDTFWLEPGYNSYSVKVKLVNELSNLQYVYIVNNLTGDEKNKLEDLNKDE